LVFRIWSLILGRICLEKIADLSGGELGFNPLFYGELSRFDL
jgi:hypothetical protein